MEKRIEGLLQIIVSVAIVTAILVFSEQIANLSAYGYAGVFLIALLGSATIILPSPAFAAIIAMAAYLDPVLVGLVGGIGSGIGELTGYMAGDGARNILNDRIKESKGIEEFVRKHDVAAVFVLSVIPNPLFDIAGIIAGGLKIPWWHFLAACILGRILRYVVLGLIGAFTLNLLS